MKELNLFYRDEYDSNKYIDARGDIIIAKGGDGTLLRAINLYRHLNKPFFGIGAGTENFLMNSDHFVHSKAKYKIFNLIKVNIDGKDYQAFNDVMIGGDMNSWIHFSVQDKDKIIGDFSGGGIIISTPQGSTGINKNNGGVILPLSSYNWSFTGDKVNRKINYVIEPKDTRIYCESRTNINVWIDGHNKIINNIKDIKISQGEKVVVIFNDYRIFKRKRQI